MKVFLITFFAAIVFILPASLTATTYYVNPGERIQDAIDASTNGDTIIVRAGTYTGDGNRDLDFSNGLLEGQTRAITLVSESGADVTIIDCQGTELDPHRGFDFHSGEDTTSVVDGFTITNGWTDWDGGGIRCENLSSPTITNCIISGNSAEYGGGGISCYMWSHPTITNCTISDNSAESSGGGINCFDSSPTITNCTISGNLAVSFFGGGISCYMWSHPTITNCTISDNSAELFGGGIDCFMWSHPTINNCTISGNTVDEGGGIYCYEGSSPTITNCTISGNSAELYGGAIYCEYFSSPMMTNCTISGNSAEYGGGIYCNLYSNPTIANCILWANTAPTGHEIALRSTTDPSTLTVRYSDVQGGEGEAYIESGCTLDLDGTNIDADPLFVYAAGGNYRLGYSSPCIDAGTSEDTPTTDLLGRPRYDDPTTSNTGGGTPDYYDIGAYEFKGYYVNWDYGNDNDDGLSWENAKATIQAGIDAASSGSAVIVADGIYTGSNNRDLDFGGKAITLQSVNGADNTIIDCEGSGRGFYFHSGEGPDSVVDGFTIQNGYTSTGAGICVNSSSNPTIINCKVINNETTYVAAGIYIWGSSSATIINCTIADNHSGNNGGGIYISGSDATITNCIFTGNSANIGGGIFISSGEQTIANCTISGNSANLDGGGIYNTGNDLKIINCIYSGNSAGSSGGGIYCSTNSPEITNCVIAGNTAVSNGGGIRCSSSNPTITNSILWDNGPDEIYLYYSTSTVTYCDIEGGWTGMGNIDADPLFVYAAGGNYRLKSGSPCIDAATSDGAPAADIEEIPRWDDLATQNTGTGPGGDYYDIGAHEFKGYYVNGDPAEGNDSYDGLAPHWDGTHGPKRSIRAGLDCDPVGSSYSVVVAPWTYTGVGNRDLDFGGKAITLESESGADVTIIDCQGTELDPHRGFYFHSGETTASVVDGFTITNGYTNYPDNGGGIYCDGSSPTIVNCTISGNSVESPLNSGVFITLTPGDGGGGISCVDSSPTIANCIIIGNTVYSTLGGGISCYLGNPVISNCMIAGNSSKCRILDGNLIFCGIMGGGGIFCGVGGDATITNCTITGNEAISGGGVLCSDRTNVMINNCILWGNAGSYGHEIALMPIPFTLSTSTLTVRYSDVQGGADEVFVESGCTLDLDGTNIDADPLFVLGPLHRYYLSDTAAGQPATSPCVDGGSDTAANLGLDTLTTSNAGYADTGMVDIGYHAPPHDWLYITCMSLNGNDITICWNASPSTSYVVEWSTNPGFVTYIEVPVGVTYTWTDVGGVLQLQRYYRVRKQ